MHPSLNIAFTKEVKTMDMNEPVYTYFYNVVDKDGFPVTKYSSLTREQFINVTGIDPVTNKCIYT